jgi:hypothetical protein
VTPVPIDMTRRLGTIVLTLLVLQSFAVLLLVAPPVAAEINEIVVPPGETWTWEGREENLTSKVTVQGTLVVRDYVFHFNITQDGEASFWVSSGGRLVFENVTLLHDNQSAYLFFKVEGTFECHDSYLEHLTGQFVTGGGVKVVNGAAEMYNTRISDCEVQAVYVEGPQGSALLDNCTIDAVQYGVHVTSSGTATIRNESTLELFTAAGVLANHGEVEIANSTIFADRTNTTQCIAVRDGQARVFDSEVHNAREDGIELTDESSGLIVNTRIYNNKVGIRMTSSSAVVKDCNIHDCLDGLNIYLSDPKVSNTHLVNNLNGISSKECKPDYVLTDCTIGGNSQYGVYAVSEGLSETGTVWTNAQDEENGLARVLQLWLLDVNVTDQTASPISGAEVVVRDSEGKRVFNSTTDALGSVRDIDLEGLRILNDGTEVVQGKYTIRVEDGDRWAEHKVTMDKDKTLVVSLGEPATITESPYFWAVPVMIVLLVIVAVLYYWFYIR